MKHANKILRVAWLMIFVISLFASAIPMPTLAASGEGTATVGGGSNQTVSAGSTTTFTIALTVGADGIADTAPNPTFTIPTGFTAPDATPTPGGPSVAGDWWAESDCPLTELDSTATGNVITVGTGNGEGTGCVAGNVITLSYMGTAPLLGAAPSPIVIQTASGPTDSLASIASPPTITVSGSTTIGNASAGVQTTNNLAGTHLTGATDAVIGGFTIAAAGENIVVTNVGLNISVTNMDISEVSNVRIAPDNGGGGGIAGDWIMQDGELAAALVTVASPIRGSQPFTFAAPDTISDGETFRYFIVATIADTVTHGDTLDIEAVGASSTGTTSGAVITPTGSSSNDTRIVTHTGEPSVVIALDDSALTAGETTTVTFTFSGLVTGFDADDVTVDNGSIGEVTQSEDDGKIYTATLTPTAGVSDDTNVVTVGTGWTYSEGGAIPLAATESDNYTVSTVSSRRRPLTTNETTDEADTETDVVEEDAQDETETETDEDVNEDSEEDTDDEDFDTDDDAVEDEATPEAGDSGAPASVGMDIDGSDAVYTDENDLALAERFMGGFFLAVNQGGAIYWLNPDNLRLFNVRFTNALYIFQHFALGIANEDLEKIPLAGEDTISDIGNRLKGKFLLQVEGSGNIWYVDLTGHRHSITWYNLMTRFTELALGATDESLNRFERGNF